MTATTDTLPRRGDSRIWLKTGRAVTLAEDPYELIRADGSVTMVASTVCRRLVNVAALAESQAAVPKTEHRKPNTAEPRSPRGAETQPANERRKTGPAARPESPSAAAVPEPRNPKPETHSPCDILAVDFLNLLVRAWHTGKPTESHAVRSMFQTVANAVRTLQPQRVVFALDGGHKHRSELLPSYKAHRPPSDPDLTRQKQLAESAIAAAGLCAVRIFDYEADDVLASIASQFENVVICSSDKDLLLYSSKQRIYHPWKGGSFARAEDVLGVSPAQVSDYLALCGDASDGIPGVHGVGPKTALTLLQAHGSLEGVLVAAAQGRISGAVGKKLASARQEALLSHQLVALVDNLPLPELHRWQPLDGWQSKLVDLRLGNVAAIVDSIADVLQKAVADDSKDTSSSSCDLKSAVVTNGLQPGFQSRAASSFWGHTVRARHTIDGVRQMVCVVSGTVLLRDSQAYDLKYFDSVWRLLAAGESISIPDESNLSSVSPCLRENPTPVSLSQSHGDTETVKPKQRSLFE